MRRIHSPTSHLYGVKVDTMGTLKYTIEDFVLDPDFRKWILQSDSESNIRWEKFLEKEPKYRDDILLARKIVLYLEQKESRSDSLEDFDRVDIWHKIKERTTSTGTEDEPEALVVPISSEAVLNNKKNKKERESSRWSFSVKYAAVLLISVGLAILWILSGEEGGEQENTVVASWLNHETPLGTKSTITLSDGSVVTLNSGSQIRYMEKFAGSEREVFLEGEAFFEVAKDSIKPFIVHAAGLSTHALGTSFNIKAFRDEQVEISLISGVIEVKSQDGMKKEVIQPGEGIYTISDGENWKRRNVDLERVTAWMNKTIIFDNTPFLNAVHTLEKWYGVKIHLLNFKDEHLKVSGKYTDETLKNILDGWGYGMRFDYRIKGKEVMIEFNQ